ncbi:MAG: sigma-70 family RNA polymerase sigma factor [Pseudomonadota bacterium]
MARFQETQWSIIERAGNDRDALDALCRTYRPVVVAWFGRRGLSREVAEDYTQSFFARLLEKKTIDSADPSRGRFRTFLLTSVRNFYLNELAKQSAQKRGGDQQHVPYEDDGIASDSPQDAFDRDFAAVLLAKALHRMEEEAIAAGRGELFRHLRPFLIEAPDRNDYDKLTAVLEMRRNTVAVAIHRMRARLREAALEELRETVSSEAAFQAELDALKHSIG